MHLQTAYDHLTCSIMPSSIHHRETLPITSVCTQWSRLGNNQGYTCGCTTWTWAHPWSQNVVVFTRVSHGTLHTAYGHLTLLNNTLLIPSQTTLPIISVISVAHRKQIGIWSGLHMWEYCVDMKSPLVPKCRSLHCSVSCRLHMVIWLYYSFHHRPTTSHN